MKMSRRETLLTQLIGTGGGEAANRLGQLGTLVLAGWLLGVDGLGIIGFAWSLTTVAQALAQGGPELAGVRELARAVNGVDGPVEAPARVISEVTRLKLYLALLAVPLLVLVGLTLGHGDQAATAQLAVQVLAMIAMTLGYTWALRGLWRGVEQGVIRTVQAASTLILLWPLLSVWPSPLAVPLAEAAAAVLALGVARYRLGILVHHVSPTGAGMERLIGPSLRLGLATVLATLVWMTPIVAAARWAPIDQVSYLTGTVRLILGPTSPHGPTIICYIK